MAMGSIDSHCLGVPAVVNTTCFPKVPTKKLSAIHPEKKRDAKREQVHNRMLKRAAKGASTSLKVQRVIDAITLVTVLTSIVMTFIPMFMENSREMETIIEGADAAFTAAWLLRLLSGLALLNLEVQRFYVASLVISALAIAEILDVIFHVLAVTSPGGLDVRTTQEFSDLLETFALGP